MTPEEMQALLKADPFQPFRVHLDDGRAFDIQRPELNMVTRRTFAIALRFPDPAIGWAKDFVLLDWSNIRAVEPVTSAGSSHSTGERGIA